MVKKIKSQLFTFEPLSYISCLIISVFVYSVHLPLQYFRAIAIPVPYLSTDSGREKIYIERHMIYDNR